MSTAHDIEKTTPPAEQVVTEWTICIRVTGDGDTPEEFVEDILNSLSPHTVKIVSPVEPNGY